MSDNSFRQGLVYWLGDASKDPDSFWVSTLVPGVSILTPKDYIELIQGPSSTNLIQLEWL